MKLNEICEVYSGYALKSFNDIEDGLPVVKIGNILTDGTLNLDECQYTTDSVNEKYYSNKGDIYIALSGATTGKIGIMDTDDKYVINQRVGIVRQKSNDVPQEYIKFFLLRQTDRILQEAAGCAQPNISPKQIAEYIVPDASKGEMQEICEILDKTKRIIDSRKAELAALDDLIKARFVELFGEQELNPYGFEKTTIGECCTLKSGTSLPADKENEGGNIPYIKVGDMNYPGNEKYITTSSRYVTEVTAGKGLFEVGSIIFPKRGGAIGTNKKRLTKLPICADLNVMGVSSNGKLLPEYLLAYFDMIDMGALSDGSSVPQINNKNITPLAILLPPQELQEQFADFVKQVDKSKFI